MRPGRTTRGRIIDAAGCTLIPDARVARTFFHKLRGLLYRNALSANQGWWFHNCHGVHTCGMRFSIDVLHLSSRGEVLAVHERLPPWRFSHCSQGKHVIELAAGSALRLGITPGTHLEFRA